MEPICFGLCPSVPSPRVLPFFQTAHEQHPLTLSLPRFTSLYFPALPPREQRSRLSPCCHVPSTTAVPCVQQKPQTSLSPSVPGGILHQFQANLCPPSLGDFRRPCVKWTSAPPKPKFWLLRSCPWESPLPFPMRKELSFSLGTAVLSAPHLRVHANASLGPRPTSPTPTSSWLFSFMLGSSSTASFGLFVLLLLLF